MTLAQDFRFALRLLRKNPGFTAVAVLSLALAIGGNTAIFSVLYAVVLKPLPYKSPEQLTVLWSTQPKKNLWDGIPVYADILDWKRQNRSFADLALFSPFSRTVIAGDEAEAIPTAGVGANFFSVMGVPPLLGRTFTAEEELHRERVAVLSYSLWQRRFGGATDVIGKTIQITGQFETGKSSLHESRIIGVMPKSFRFPEQDTRLWEPFSLLPWMDQRMDTSNQLSRLDRAGSVVARLRPGVSLDQAQAEMHTIAGQLEQQYPDSNRGRGVRVTSVATQTVERSRASLWILSGAVALVLLIACANVAHLFLARGLTRAREFAVRAAVGASSGRLKRQVLVEALTLAMAAGVAGLALGAVAIDVILLLGPRDIPRLDETRLDVTVFAFNWAVSLLTGIVFGLLPARTAAASDPNRALKQGGRVSAEGAGARMTLVAAQFAMAMVLLCGAGLLIRSFLRLQSVDAGFRADDVLTMKIQLHQHFASGARRLYFEQVLERLREMPGVTSAGLVNDVFIEGSPLRSLTIDGREPYLPEAIGMDVIGGDYFQALGVPLLRGRLFNNQDAPRGTDSEPKVMIVNDAMARRFWPGEDPIGKRFKWGDAASKMPWYTVVGVVGNMRRQGLEKEPIPQVFEPHRQRPTRWMMVVARTATTEPMLLAGSARSAIQGVDRTVPVYDVKSGGQLLGEQAASRRFQTTLLVLFSGLALALAAVGIYGLLHYTVAQRTHEIGIRMAVGASSRDILRLVLVQGLRLVVAGAAAGLVGALWVMRALVGMLYGVTPADPATFAAVVLLLMLIAVMAGFVPARRAARVDPIVALRQD